MTWIRITATIISSFVIFGLPLWNLARLRNKKHPLWWIAPPILFVLLFFLSRFFESQELIGWYRLIKTGAYLFLITGLALFGMTFLGTLIELAFKLSRKIIFWLIVGMTLVYLLMASINGQRLVVKEINLPAHNISRDYNFIHISDLHTGSTDREHAQRVVDMIKPLNPEFVVITGDFIDEFFVETSDIDPFNQINQPIYLITGNHEYYLEEGKIDEVIQGTNIQLIDHMKVAFEEIDIIGVNELATVEGTLKEIGGINPDRYTILLDHQPRESEVHKAEQEGVALMLSGHTHKGQMWPMGLLMYLRLAYVAGLYEIGEMFLYVNQGTGTLGPKLRLGTVNEITNITLSPKK